MIVILAFLSLLGVVAAVVLPGWSDLVLLAGPCLLASLWLWWRGRIGRVRKAEPKGRSGRPLRRGKAQPMAPSGPQAILDGSNILYWQDNTPSLEPVLQVIRIMAGKGYAVGVMFDANAGYKIGERYLDDRHLAGRLGLPDDRVLVVPKGVPADQYILGAARKLGARVVTNDRYRDWAEAHPEVARPGFLIRGGVREGAVWLNERDLAAGEPATAGP
jgi:hypothetical protein